MAPKVKTTSQYLRREEIGVFAPHCVSASMVATGNGLSANKNNTAQGVTILGSPSLVVFNYSIATRQNLTA